MDHVNAIGIMLMLGCITIGGGFLGAAVLVGLGLALVRLVGWSEDSFREHTNNLPRDSSYISRADVEVFQPGDFEDGGSYGDEE